MKMSGRFKPYILIILAGLIVALVLGPPLAFASKLPTACNIFQEKKAPKLETCGHQATFAKDKFHSDETGFSAGPHSGNEETAMVQNNHLSPFVPFTSIIDLTPIRC
jgi:hypothetical protein